jgi:hypothetical protein
MEIKQLFLSATEAQDQFVAGIADAENSRGESIFGLVRIDALCALYDRGTFPALPTIPLAPVTASLKLARHCKVKCV